MEVTSPDINDIVRIYAKEKGLSEPAAWAAIRGVLAPKNEVLNTLESILQGKGTTSPALQQPRTLEALIQKNDLNIERSRQEFELKKIELEEKKAAREERKLEFEEKRLENQHELALAQMKHEKELAAQKMEQDRIFENRRLASKEDFDQKMLLLQESKSGQPDFFEQVNQVKTMEDMFTKSKIDQLEALGVDASALRKFMGGKPKSSITLEKAFELIGPLLEKLKPSQEQQDAPSGFEVQQKQQVERQLKLEDEQRRIRIETENKMKEKELLQKQLELETRNRELWQEQRNQLESIATELGIQFDTTVTNDQLFDWIEHQKSIIEQSKRKAEEAEAVAMANEPEPAEQIQDIPENVIPSQPPADVTEQPEKTLGSHAENQGDITLVVGDQTLGAKADTEVEPEEVQAPEEPDKNKSKRGKKGKKEKNKGPRNYTIYKDEGSDEERKWVEINTIEAVSHKIAALQVIDDLNATKDNPAMLKVSDGDTESDKLFKVYSYESETQQGLKYTSPWIKEIKGKRGGK